jgi:hypothetical protein
VANQSQDNFEEGIKVIMSNLNKEIDKIEGRTRAGMLAGGLVIERESNQHVPREYGDLVNSSYVRKAMDDEDAVEIGYSASYAVYVHENLEPKHAGEPRPSGLGDYWGPHGEPRFLTNAVDRTTDEVLRVIASYAK